MNRRARRLVGRRIRRRRRLERQLDAYAAAAGIHLYPRQREFALNILDSKRISS